MNLRQKISNFMKTDYRSLNCGFMINPYAFGGGAVGGWVELGRTTLGAGNANIAVSSLPDKRYYMTLTNIVGRSAITTNSSWRLNADAGSNYAMRYNYDGANETGAGTQSGMYGIINHPANTTCLNIAYWANLSTKEKLMMNWGINQNIAGVGIGAVPARYEAVGKHAQTTNPISTITLNSGGGETFNTGSEVVVLGYDPADTHTTNFWTELASVNWSSGTNIDSGTITAKKYLWIQGWIKGTDANLNGLVTFNADTASNYANRRSSNGGADSAGASRANIDTGLSATGGMEFLNMFIINNSANEKLCIWHNVTRNATGAGFAPSRKEGTGKWANTSAQITSINLDGNSTLTGGTLKVWGSN